jgi:cell division GTPase FtsZ
VARIRAIKAAELAVASPLLEASIDGAHGVLLSVQGGSNLGIFEINDAAKLVQEAVHPEANIIFGAVIDDTLGDEVRVTVIAAGFDGGEPVDEEAGPPLAPLRRSGRRAGSGRYGCGRHEDDRRDGGHRAGCLDRRARAAEVAERSTVSSTRQRRQP